MFFFVSSISAETIVSILGNSSSPFLKTEIESAFARTNWEDHKFVEKELEPKEENWNYKLNLSVLNNQFQIVFYSKNSSTPIYISNTPLDLKKNSIENFEKFLEKRKIRDNFLHSGKEEVPKVRLFSNKDTYSEGEFINLGFETLQKGYVYILLFSNEGDEPILLYPNETQKEKELDTQTIISIGDSEKKIRASKPLGKEFVRAFYFTEPWNLIKLKRIPNSKFHWITINKNLSKKAAVGMEDEIKGKIQASSDLSWEIIAK